MRTFLMLLASSFIAGGINFTFVKIGVKEISPIAFIFLRFLLATLIVSSFWIKTKEKMRIKDLLKIFPFTINVILFSFGLARTTVLAGGTITLIIPVFVGILSYFLIREPLRRKDIIGLMFAFIGVTFILLESNNNQNSLSFGSLSGNLILIVSSTSFAFYTVGVRKLSRAYSQATILFFTFLTAFVTSGILLPIEILDKSFRPTQISPIAYSSVVVLAVAAVILYFMYQKIIKTTSAFLASLMLYGQFVFTNLSGIALFKEKITASFILGSILILSGVFYATTYGYIKK